MGNKTEKSIQKLGDLLNIDDGFYENINDDSKRTKPQKVKKTSNYFKNLKKELKTLAKCDDKDYVKTIMKKMVERGMVVIEMLEQEMKKDVFARDAEVAGQLINSVTSIVEKINSLNIAERKLEHDERKIRVQEKKLENDISSNKGLPVPGNVQNNNIVAVGTMADVVKLINDHGDSIPEIPVNAEVVDGYAKDMIDE